MDPALALADGVVGVSEEIVPELLFEAYNYGIFPWPHEENEPILWFCPPRRGVLDFAELHIPKSLLKSRRRCSWVFTVNQDFDQVIKACSQSFRPEQAGTWITEAMMGAFREFHRQGYAHSIECWEQGKLIGGLYGTYVAGVFSGESMFYYRSGASKLSLLYLIELLASQGIEWMDIQMLTPHMKALGAKTISRRVFLERLEKAKAKAKPLVF